jgi:isoquinoline 1-oxidoreductase subunit alpha
MITLTVNGESRTVDADDSTPLLWILRDHLNLTGTKYGCGMSLCGACTVHLDGQPVRACALPLSTVAGKSITTIEGIGGEQLNPVQTAWLAHDVAQCGYCQSGQIMAASALLQKNANPSDAEIDAAMSGIVCRCGSYQRIREAIHAAAQDMALAGGEL